jgi:hypothetical protein
MRSELGRAATGGFGWGPQPLRTGYTADPLRQNKDGGERVVPGVGKRPQADMLPRSAQAAAHPISYSVRWGIGSDTGTRYRIRHGHIVNIDQLDSAGNKVCGWCFVPEGDLAGRDCMLAQKIALETFENEALAIANRGR